MATALYPLTFAKTNLTTPETDLAIGHGDGDQVSSEVLIPFQGAILGLSAAGNADITGDETTHATFAVTINGVKQATPTVTINLANPRRGYTLLNHQVAPVVKPGDVIQVVVTTVALSATSVDYSVDVWCTIGNHAPG